MLVAKRPVSSDSVGVVCTGRMLGNPRAIPPMLGASYDFGWPKQILWRIGVDHCGEPTEPRHLGWTRPSMCSCILVFPSDTAVNHSWSRLLYHAKKSLGCTCAGVVKVVCGTSGIHCFSMFFSPVLQCLHTVKTWSLCKAPLAPQQFNTL